jgi:glycosyltransferase involved in cell wall biosynthesis
VAKLRRVHILAPKLLPFDAVGNDVVGMRAVLAEAGYQVRVFAESVHPSLASLAQPLNQAPRKAFQSPGDILIYHHAMGWPVGEDILSRTRNRIVLRYHNITPAIFFAKYSEPFTITCSLGAESTRRLARLPDALVLGASAYNCDEFVALGVDRARCHVLPPLHAIEDFNRERFDVGVLETYSSAKTNILFVGGVKPNKGHARAIRVFAEYRGTYNEHSRLIFVGSIDPRLTKYVEELKQVAADLGVADAVVFSGTVDGSQMKSFYASAAVFLCSSEHEGFCVPLVEALYFRLPVVAWGVTAVPETLDGCGLVFDRWNVVSFAAALNDCVEDDLLAERLGQLGRTRYRECFHPRVLKKKLLDFAAGID